jgi:hypothetical protein
VADEERPDLSIPLRALIEDIAAQMGMERGRWRVEFIFEQGVLRECFRHDERIPGDQLDARFAGAESR